MKNLLLLHHYTFIKCQYEVRFLNPYPWTVALPLIRSPQVAILIFGCFYISGLKSDAIPWTIVLMLELIIGLIDCCRPFNYCLLMLFNVSFKFAGYGIVEL